MREITEIQEVDLARLADQTGELKQALLGLIAEIDRDHYRPNVPAIQGPVSGEECVA